MKSLRTALASAGLVPEQSSHVAEAEEVLEIELETARREKALREQRLKTLQTTNSLDLFQQEARELLITSLNDLQLIIGIAHFRMKSKRGGSQLNAKLRELRQKLSGVRDEEERRVIVEREFSNK